MFTSLRSRLWLTYFLLIGGMIVIAGIGLLGYLVVPSRQASLRLQEAANRLRERGDLLENRAPRAILVAIQRADRLTGYRIAILDAQGTVQADSRASIVAPLPQLELSTAERPPVHQFRDGRGQVWLYTTRPLEEGGWLLVANLRPAIQEIFRQDFLPPLFISGLIASLAALVLTAWMEHWVAAPIRRMARAAQTLTAGQHTPIPVEGPEEVKTLARAFNEMTVRVQASQKSQRDLVANVSHELKTPLTSIQGFAQAILDGAASTPEALQQAAGVIFDEAGRMHRIVLDLLDLARMDAGSLEFQRGPLDMAQLLRGVAQKLSPQASQGEVHIQTEIGPLPVLVGDADRLVQVFTNLLDNAIKHSPAGSRVVLRAGQREHWIEIAVQDDGPGIAPEDLPRIFERFYQTDKARRGGSRRGAGLGLAIAREIILAHHGEIQARSSSGQGTVFVVKLPVAMPDDSTVAKRKSTGTSAL